MKYFLLLLFLLFSLSSSNTTQDKIKCLIENDKIKENIFKVINAFIEKEELNTIFQKIITVFYELKDEFNNCFEDEPVLKAGCRYEEQFKNCQLYSCEYMDEYECMEYCFRKYC